MTGQRVVITAGAAGIGRAMARRFSGDGAQIAICDIDPGAVAAMQAEMPDAICAPADVTDETAMSAFLATVQDAWGGVDVLCANAGTGGPAGPIETLELGDWQACLSANLDGAFLASRWAAPLMKSQCGGVILLTSSTAGLFGYPNRSPYCTAKWGIIGLMKTLAMELGPHGVRVNALCPGAVEGPRMDRVIAAESTARGVDEATQRAIYVQGVSMKTWVSADDIAETVHWLASPAAARISGQAMAVDGHTETLAL